MNKSEIKDLIQRVNEFERIVEPRVNKLLKASGSNATFDRIVWGNCDENELCVEVSVWGFPEEGWKEYFPLDYFAEGFDIDAFVNTYNKTQKEP